MKKIYILILVLPFMFSTNVFSQAQEFILNGEFEVWSSTFQTPIGPADVPEFPEGWLCGNFINAANDATGGQPADTSVFSVSGGNQYDGNFSCEINTVYYEDNPTEGEIPDTSGVMLTGTFEFDFATMAIVPQLGYPFNQRPTDFEFYGKYAPQDNDVAYVYVELFRWDGGTREVVAEGGLTIDSEVLNYQLYEFSLNYLIQDVDPDSAIVSFSASDASDPKIGSKLTVDNAAFKGGTVGILPVLGRVKNINYYPNPATEIVSFEFDVNHPVNTMEIYTLEGRLVETIGINSAQLKNIQVANYNNGLYMFRCIDNDNRIVETGKFLVNH